MKKSLLACAIAAALPLAVQAAPATKAQTSTASTAASGPVFYGRLNVSLDNVDVDSSRIPAIPPLGTANNTFDNAGLSGAAENRYKNAWNLNSVLNWVGIKGDVALYNNNLKAIYQVERGIDITEGNGNLTARNTYVGLAGDNWGRLFVGNYDGVVKQAGVKADLFNNTEADIDLVMGGENRYSNTLNYETPNLSGLSFAVQLRPGENKRANGASLAGHGENKPWDGLGVSVSFTQDNFWAVAAYERGMETNERTSRLYSSLFASPAYPTGDDYKTQTLRVSAGVNVGNVTLAALAQQRKEDHNLGNALGTAVGAPFPLSTGVRNDYLLSGSVAATDRLKLKAQVASTKGDFFIKTLDDRQIDSWTVGADYALGKKVTSYVLYSNNIVNGKFVKVLHDKSQYNVAAVGLSLSF